MWTTRKDVKMQDMLEPPGDLKLTITDTPADEDNLFIRQKIREFNNNHSPAHRAVRSPGNIVPLSIFVRADDQQLVGGLIARSCWDWLEIDYFWVNEPLRGQGLGARLLRLAETEAIMRGCTRIHLKTFSFQARDFYQKFGYRSIGQLDDFPPGETYYWMRKELGRQERVTFRNVHTDDDVLAFLVQMNRNRPERQQIIDHIVAQLGRLSLTAPAVVELCSGPGMVARQLVQRISGLRYTGIDFSHAFVDFVRRQIAAFGEQAQVIQADLNEDFWPELVQQPVNAIVSMQSLHDLGEEYHVNRAYGLACQLLAPGGMLINADLTTSGAEPESKNPGRLPLDRHLQLLRAHGFGQVACTLMLNDFVCVVGVKPA
jgi:GNAT superfamily N-acetyltransferase